MNLANYVKWVAVGVVLIAGFASAAENPSASEAPFVLTVCPSSDDNPRNSEGDIVVLKDGSLLLAWSKFSGSADHARAVIAAKTSPDGGRTWSDDYVLQENTGEQNVMSISFLRLQSGRILFFFLQKNANDDLQLFVRESLDEAKTWSPPLRITQGPGYHIMNNARVIQCRNGRILAPIAYCSDIGKDANNQVCFCYYSDDDGATWKKGAGEVGLNGSAAMEPGLTQRADGSILMIIRTSLDRIYQSVSLDRGETWSEASPMDLVSPAAPAVMAPIPDRDDLIIIWNNNPLGNKAGWQGRTPLTAALSRAGGAGWENIQNLADDPDSGYAYTSVTFYQNRVLLTYYHWKKGKPNFVGTDLVFHSLPVQWFYQQDSSVRFRD
ncbi:MAG: exo-alpha-sialidase [Candidatus Omnitrophica bacterium]|nr:exo-alpha-sialidase [Candidatus Omnitrophota bacterium]